MPYAYDPEGRHTFCRPGKHVCLDQPNTPARGRYRSRPRYNNANNDFSDTESSDHDDYEDYDFSDTGSSNHDDYEGYKYHSQRSPSSREHRRDKRSSSYTTGSTTPQYSSTIHTTSTPLYPLMRERHSAKNRERSYTRDNSERHPRHDYAPEPRILYPLRRIALTNCHNLTRYIGPDSDFANYPNSGASTIAPQPWNAREYFTQPANERRHQPLEKKKGFVRDCFEEVAGEQLQKGHDKFFGEIVPKGLIKGVKKILLG